MDTSAAEADGPGGSRRFARTVNQPLSRGDLGFAAARLEGTPYTSKPSELPPAGPEGPTSGPPRKPGCQSLAPPQRVSSQRPGRR